MRLICSSAILLMMLAAPPDAYAEEPNAATRTEVKPEILGGPGESCRARSDCSEGLKCIANICTDASEGANCQARSDCGGKLSCFEGICTSDLRKSRSPKGPTAEEKLFEGVHGLLGGYLAGGPILGGLTEQGGLYGQFIFAIRGGVLVGPAEIVLEFSPMTHLAIVGFSPQIQLATYFGGHIPIAGPVSWKLGGGVGFLAVNTAQEEFGGGYTNNPVLQVRLDLLGISIKLPHVLIDISAPSGRLFYDFHNNRGGLSAPFGVNVSYVF